MKKGRYDPDLAKRIRKLVCEEFGCSHEDMKSSTNINARRCLVDLLKNEYDFALKGVQEEAGLTYDAAVYNDVNGWKKASSNDPDLKQKHQNIRAAILAEGIGDAPEGGSAPPAKPESQRGRKRRNMLPGTTSPTFDAAVARFFTPGLLFSESEFSLGSLRSLILHSLWQDDDKGAQAIADETGVTVAQVYQAIGEIEVRIKEGDLQVIDMRKKAEKSLS